LDGTRGVAAFGVMFYHLWFNSKWFSGTNTFVDFFFVMSGLDKSAKTSRVVVACRLDMSAYWVKFTSR
jgi:hypothetical protein